MEIGYIHNTTPVNGNITFYTNISSPDPLEHVYLYYALLQEKWQDTPENWTFNRVEMTDSGGGNYTAKVSFSPSDKMIRFYVEARDIYRKGWLKPYDAPDYAYYVVLSFGNVSYVRLNEILPAPSAVDWDGDGTADVYKDEWIEFYNNGTDIVSLKGCHVQVKSYYLDIDFNVLIWPGDVGVIYGSQMKLYLANSGPTTVTLYNPDGSEAIDTMTYQDDPGYDKSWGRDPDGWGVWIAYDNPTPGEPNNPGG